MRIASDVLRRFVAVPAEPKALRELLDDVGVEVKRAITDGDNTTFTIELLANRGDHYCYEGVAREISGRTGASLSFPERATMQVGAGPSVGVLSPLCLRYSATLLERRGHGSLPADAQRVLDAAGLANIGAVVDATNLANCELGQPTHAFDADKIVGELVVRESEPGERAWLLFTESPREIPAGTLVIADDVKILAVAGVIGCEESKTTAETTRVLLESATFDPVAVRIARRALDISTDASARFERGADPERVLTGAGRVLFLLEAAGWERVGPTTLIDNEAPYQTVIRLDLDAAATFLGLPLQPDDALERLSRYGYRATLAEDEPGCADVVVPSWRRWDVSRPADLHEDLARSIGYNATPIALPAVGVGTLPSPAEQRRDRVDEVLMGMGFYEVYTDGFYARAMRERLGITEGHPLFAHVETQNALDRAYSLLKNQCLGQAIELVASAQRMRASNIKAWEWTRTFHPIPQPHAGDRNYPPCTERKVLWAICTGEVNPTSWSGPKRLADMYFLKGLLEELSIELGLDLAFGTDEGQHPLSSCLHPGRQAPILLDGELVGIAGEVHPELLPRFKLKGARPCYLEIDDQALVAAGAPPGFAEPSTLQPIVRNLAFTLPHRIEADAISAWLHASGPDYLDHVDITDLFAHTEATLPVRTVTFALTFAPSAEGERSAEEVNQVCEQLVTAVHEQFGDQGVKLR